MRRTAWAARRGRPNARAFNVNAFHCSDPLCFRSITCCSRADRGRVSPERCRTQRGHTEVEQHRLRLTAQRRRLAARVVADHCDDPAVLADASVVDVLERVAAAVHASFRVSTTGTLTVFAFHLLER